MTFRPIRGGMPAVSRTQGRRGVKIDVRISRTEFCFMRGLLRMTHLGVQVVQKEACKWRTDMDLKVSSMK
jgi:hypothetical protein